MKKNIINIGVGFDHMRILHDGLGEFSVQLGRRIASQASEWRRRYGVIFSFHMRNELHGLFGEDVFYLPQNKNQKFIHRAGIKFNLWHTLNQHAKFAAPLGTKHWVMTVHDFNFLYDPTARKKTSENLKNRFRLARTDSVIAISDYVAGDLREKFGYSKPIERIYNGASADALADSAGLPELPAGRYLFHLSRMAPSKNPRAILNLAQNWPEQSFVLAGPSSADAENIRGMARIRGLHNVMVLTDITEGQKSWLYQNCLGFLLPSWTEGFGLTVIEAMRHGKPVFLSNLTCLPEIGGAHAFYWRDFSAGHMRGVIEAGLAEAERPGFVEQMRAHAASFTWDRCCAGYLDYYRQQLGLASCNQMAELSSPSSRRYSLR
jgi:glycosyltransferase involved in cell wall biosynthesis